MRKKRIKMKTKIYPMILSCIIVLSVYLLIRFATLSFSDNIGQADLSFKEALFSNVCCMAMEEGSSLVSFSEEEEGQYTFPIKLVADTFVIQKFTNDESVLTANAKSYTDLYEKNDSVTEEEEYIQTMKTDNTKNNIDFYEIGEDYLSMEYILTNGAIYNSHMVGLIVDGQSQTGLTEENDEQLQIGYSQGDVSFEETEDNESVEDGTSVETINTGGSAKYTLDQLKDINFLVRNFYIVDKSTKVTDELFDAEKLLSKDMTIKQENDAPQILIYHTHSQETYIDSRPGKAADTVVGVGSYLTDILKEEYDYNVIHDTTTYDIVDGKEDRNVAYDVAEEGLEKILKENPTIEVVIDIHRDSGAARTTVVDGEETAQIMLFNGLSRDQNGPLTRLDNPNLQSNLAFSLQLQLKSLDICPGVFFKNYLKCYRFNLHVRPKSLLMELGTESNTLQSAKNAMVPFAEVLDTILQGE